MSEQDEQEGPPTLIVGVGASAGGLEATKRLFQRMPADSGMAFVVVMHLEPSSESHLAQLLAAATELTVVQAKETQPVERDHIYVIAPNRVLTFKGGQLHSTGPTAPHGHRKPVDTLLSSLAEERGERAVGIILSGSGNNGSVGLKDIKAHGGLCLVQTPQTAEYDGMPNSAIATGVADHVLAPEDMPGLLLAPREGPEDRPPAPLKAEGADGDEQGEQDEQQSDDDAGVPEPLGRVLQLLGQAYGVNFRGAYKRGTIARRAERRRSLLRLSDWDSYLDVLQSDPGEISALYRDVLIGVTEFFRDPEVWDLLAAEVIPALVERHPDDAEVPLKLWVSGCATGEEAYSFAILLLEEIERVGRPVRVQIFATDIAEDALSLARRGLYPREIENHITAERISRFFQTEAGQLRVNQEVRDCVTFASHNLLADPPFSRMDLVSCRNVLIYFEAYAQQRVLELFHFALNPEGALVLGASETVGRKADFFAPISERLRVFKPRALATAATHAPRWPPERTAYRPLPQGPPPPSKGPKVSRIVEQIVLSRYAAACVVITESLEIQWFFGPTKDYLVQPTGEARLDFRAWAKPGIYPRIGAALERAVRERERVHVDDLHVERDGTRQRVECIIEPISPLLDDSPLFLVAFRDLPRATAHEPEDAAQANEPLAQRLETDLKHTRGELQSTLEQLDHTHQEARASQEELLSLNEELQSNNEELESSKEELQSLNEEMVTINRQLEDKNTELRSANADIRNLLVSADIPILFLDRELRVRRFTPATTQVMRLVSSDVGRSIEHIKARFPGGRLVEDARQVLSTLVPIEGELETEDGHWYAQRVLPYRTEDDRIDGVCIAFHDVTERKRAARRAEEARRYAETIVATVRTGIVVLDGELRMVTANDGFRETFGLSHDETEGRFIYQVGDGQWNIPALRRLLEDVLPAHQEVTDFEIEHDFAGLGRRTMLLNARTMHLEQSPELILLSIEDITERKRAESVIRSHADELAQEHQRKDEFLAMLGHELRNPLSALIHGLDLLRLDSESPARREHIRQMMARQAKRIVSMLDQLLDLARLNAGKVQMASEPVDLAESAQAAVEAVTPLLESRGHELGVTTPSDGQPAIVLGDYARLTQVVENLLANAAKYTDEGGKIELRIQTDADTVRLSVRDNGIGMAPELIPHIFELFTQEPRTLERSAGGLGLGLPLVKRVVEMHDGTIEASSRGREQGSELIVTLPRLAERRSTPRREEPGRADGETAHPLRVLVVDDEQDAADALSSLLELKGHDPRVASDGEQALEVDEEFHPDVVLLDLGLPGIDGYEVARRLREAHADGIPLLVALTGYQPDDERLAAAGFDRHLLKPPDLGQLLEWLQGLPAAKGQRDGHGA